MALQYLFFWTSKTPLDNAYHPLVNGSPTKQISNLPRWLQNLDPQAATVDIAPFVAGVGGLAHIRQANDFGFTARASVFANPKTLLAMHRTILYVTPVILLCQASGIEYRDFIPRWSHERERRRDEEEVRKHVDVGMLAGAACWVLRMYGLRWGRVYWAPMDVVMGGALADLLHREYVKAHGL
ncbi:hypothetical protein B0A55_01861 [Friedmanniomyces simplex]|uniref:Uncharacterized protein n=1 Tax=Friedmanniomyces simplex TaxID=329884 RepID=A0A4U0XZK8_9PEZI|nr:hypothetical protein B0A55_01861 [Friedmanniomyces simplex]